MNLVKRVNTQGIIILLIVSVASAFYEWKKLPISIFIGGLLGLANLRGLAWGLKDFSHLYRPTGKVIFFSIFRFFTLALILIVLMLLKLINLIGILIGFTIIFILVLKEGIRAAKEYSGNITNEEPKNIDSTGSCHD